jgi:hypothetical protein
MPTNRTPAVARAVERVRNGDTVSAASLAEGCDASGVARSCRAAGVTVLPRGRPRAKGADAAALRVLGSGERVAVAARSEGVAARTVYKRVQEMRAVTP